MMINSPGGVPSRSGVASAGDTRKGNQAVILQVPHPRLNGNWTTYYLLTGQPAKGLLWS
jgi:hypothetical protein